uniref:Uncharacterized protein n=1 Tax=Ditylenchus dipsaci TaxID=166011 RepID=A0A915EF75_9BILA
MIHSKNKDVENKKAAWCLTLLSCFAGGVFMGTCFLDIFPHVNANYARFKVKVGWTAAYPFPELFVCSGFFLVYFLEELMLKVFMTPSPNGSVTGHGHSHAPTIQSQSSSSLKIANRAEQPLKTSAGAVNGRDSRSNSNLEDPAGMEGGRKYSNSGRYSSTDNQQQQHRDSYFAVMAHDIVMDESVRYVSSDKEQGNFLKSLTFAVAMSFHSILEGFALGVQDDTTGILTLFISLIIHKGIEAFSVGLQMSRANSKRVCVVVLTMVVYGLMTPIGSMLGVLITNLNINELVKEAIVIVLEGMAGGTFIYVTFFEVLAAERANHHSNLIQLIAILVGFLVIAGLQVNEHFSESSHGHGH